MRPWLVGFVWFLALVIPTVLVWLAWHISWHRKFNRARGLEADLIRAALKAAHIKGAGVNQTDFSYFIYKENEYAIIVGIKDGVASVYSFAEGVVKREVSLHQPNAIRILGATIKEVQALTDMEFVETITKNINAAMKALRIPPPA